MQVSWLVDVCLVRNCRTVFPPAVPVSGPSRSRASAALSALGVMPVAVAPAVHARQCCPGVGVCVPDTQADVRNISCVICRLCVSGEVSCPVPFF